MNNVHFDGFNLPPGEVNGTYTDCLGRKKSPKYRAKMSALYKQMGFKGEKIPKNYSTKGPMHIPSGFGTEPCGFDCVVIVKKHKPESGKKKSVKHRIFCECPECGVEVPLGRLHQHIGTGRCEMIREEKKFQQDLANGKYDEMIDRGYTDKEIESLDKIIVAENPVLVGNMGTPEVIEDNIPF